MRFVYMGKQKYITAIKARIGGERAGDVIPEGMVNDHPIFGRENSTVNFHHILTNLCYTSLKTGDLDTVMQNAAEMVEETRREGRLSNTFMDNLGMHKLPEGEHGDRDASCLAQHGPVCLTHAATRAREEVYTRRQEDAAQQKRVEQAQALIDKTAIAADKLATAAASKLAESRRIADLSSIEKAAEVAANKMIRNTKKTTSAAAKADKAREAQEKLVAAQALVARG